MMFEVTFYHFIGDLTRRGTKISSSPKMPTPIAFFDMRKFLKQLRRGSTLQPSHDLAWGHCRRCRDKHMDVIFAHNSTYNLDFKCLTGLADKLFHSKGYLAIQNLISILRHPHKMIFNIENCMTSITVFPVSYTHLR